MFYVEDDVEGGFFEWGTGRMLWLPKRDFYGSRLCALVNWNNEVNVEWLSSPEKLTILLKIGEKTSYGLGVSFWWLATNSHSMASWKCLGLTLLNWTSTYSNLEKRLPADQLRIKVFHNLLQISRLLLWKNTEIINILVAPNTYVCEGRRPTGCGWIYIDVGSCTTFAIT